ncbi:MAG TPA: hypothetical protein VNJ08_12520 [Bacteriovoracaceae bacterium]|nr:hypothetical protein [Bacteriovoracaceae bacterium]
MKSSFLVSLILTGLVTTTVYAQTSTVAATTTEEKSSFDKFNERLKVGYFGAYSGSSINNWDNLAPDEHGVKDPSYAHNLFNQFSFNYNFGAKMNFILNPRFTLNTGRTTGHSEETNGLLVLEDTLTGFQGVLHSSADKKFNYWTRFALRLPTSRTSRVRDITFQPDWAHSFTYDFNTTWQLGLSVSLRQWVYEQRFNADRYRVYVAPNFTYTINDTTKVQAWWETYGEDRLPAAGKDPKFQEYWQNLMVGVAKDVTPKLNIYPFIGYYINTEYGDERPLDPAWLGAWISYQIQ